VFVGVADMQVKLKFWLYYDIGFGITSFNPAVSFNWQSQRSTFGSLKNV